MPAFPDPPPTLADDRAALRLAQERDIPEILIAHQDDRTLAAGLGLTRPPSGAELGRRVEEAPSLQAVGRALWLTVTAAGSDECSGQLELRGVDNDPRRGELSVWIAPSRRGRGLGTSALALAGRWLLTDGGLERVSLLAAPDHVVLRAAAQAAGYRAEGVLRGYTLGPGGRSDAEVHSLIVADL